MADTSKLTPKALHELASLAIDMAHDKEIRPMVNKKIKTGNYGVNSLPDVEIEEIRQGVRQEFEQRDQMVAAETTRQRLEAQRQNLIASGRFSSDEVVDMEKNVMQKYGISDYEAASKVVLADRKPASSTPEIQGKTWEIPVMKKEDMEDLNGYTRRKANQVIADIMQKRA